ncbi:hypothetical protein D3C80_2032120 [compost metagenome]
MEVPVSGQAVNTLAVGLPCSYRYTGIHMLDGLEREDHDGSETGRGRKRGEA